MCGEKSTGILVWLEVIGSPPRMRGKAARLCLFSFFLGIAPAYAGKRLASAVVPPSSEDHPRVCGEKSFTLLLRHGFKGSPPRMRGKEYVSQVGKQKRRITPAYAGKRLKRSRSTVPHAAIVPLFPSVCNKPAGSDGSPAGHDAPPFLPIENAVPASPAYNLRSL